jgi:diguanylate cyclase (GGDEF)-like protein
MMHYSNPRLLSFGTRGSGPPRESVVVDLGTLRGGGRGTIASSAAHGELSLAGLFARNLRNLLALTRPDEEVPVPTSEQILAASEGEGRASLSLFRLLQFGVLPRVLGASTRSVLYLGAKDFSRDLELGSIQALKEWFRTMDLGEVEVELDEEKVLVKLAHCLTCHRLPAVGASLCTLEHGLIDGALERITGREVISKETLCRGLGDTVCQFEAYSSGGEGYLFLEDGTRPDDRRRLLSTLAQQSDVAVENLRLVQERRAQETRDPLTGLFNYRHLREHAALELVRAERYGRQVTFVMLDVDGFARVNETAGRQAGDEVLRQWAGALNAHVRRCDLVCRYGADEFLLVLPETAEQEAQAVLQRLLASVSGVSFEAAGRKFTLTASAGVASYPEDGPTVEELVGKATTSMYVAKGEGVGHVVFYAPGV